MHFDAQLNFPEQFEESIDFQEWVYLRGSGFYMKKESRGRLPLHPGLILKKEEVSSFIHSHRDDVEQVQNFFSPNPAVLRMGIIVGLTPEKQITITPKMELFPGIQAKDVHVFGDFVYVKGWGFSEVPVFSRLRISSTETVYFRDRSEAS